MVTKKISKLSEGHCPLSQSLGEGVAVNLKKRVPIINDIDKKTQKIVFDNLQIDLDKMSKLKKDLKNYKKENRS